ncbi:MAG: DUF1579 family protein [Planctomycetes bacterium]|nr:DUF1579 family protein [Planctomycetota bacterium]MCB9871105.1 DUF1579 family protein [Planctomycetota bacterium]MCB9888257.1 DUF1579 family protein [Planctomycetota bacterium]
MNTLRHILTLFLFAAPALAQAAGDGTVDPAAMQPPKPPSELGKFQPLLGYWEGSGVASDPGHPDTKWTATAWYHKVLDGFFVQEDAAITLEGMKETLLFRSFLGYDGLRKEYVVLSIGNNHTAHRAIAHWDGKSMVTASSQVNGGKLEVERWTTTVTDKKSMDILGMKAVGAGKFFAHVRGSYTRKGDEPPKVSAADAAHAFMVKAGAEMDKLKGFAGTFDFKGGMWMDAKQPEMPIRGRSITTAIYGGTVLETECRGDPSPMGTYKAWGALAWSPSSKCYVSLWVDNMGEASLEHGWFVDKQKLVFTAAKPSMGGTPSVMRSVVSLDDKGVLTQHRVHTIVGTGAAFQCFKLDYTKR